MQIDFWQDILDELTDLLISFANSAAAGESLRSVGMDRQSTSFSPPMHRFIRRLASPFLIWLQWRTNSQTFHAHWIVSWNADSILRLFFSHSCWQICRTVLRPSSAGISSTQSFALSIRFSDSDTFSRSHFSTIFRIVPQQVSQLSAVLNVCRGLMSELSLLVAVDHTEILIRVRRCQDPVRKD